MRLLIYLLAMLTGFSAAEAARPVAAASPVADTAIARTYAAVAVNASEQAQIGPARKTTWAPMAVSVPSPGSIVLPFAANTPVLRHDVLLG